MLDIARGLRIVDSAGPRHEVDDDLVGHADDCIAGYIRVRDFVDGLVFEYAERALDQRDVVRGGIHEEVDVLRCSGAAVGDDGEPTDEDVACAGVVQRAADPDEVLDLRLACVRAIVRVIHASASSKLLKR